MFTADEIAIMNAALDQALASNKRMQTGKPKFAAVFKQEEAEINALKIKINTPPKK